MANKRTGRPRSKVYGVGINDADYFVRETINGKRITCPYYATWTEMIRRCYSKAEHKRNPTYENCSAADEWLYFSTFKLWMEKQDWRGKQLDKDILFPGNKLYSPATCRFISSQLNSVLVNCNNNCGRFVGYSLHKKTGKYRSRVKDGSRIIYLGLFNDPLDSHAAWVSAKIKILEKFICDENDEAVNFGIMAHIKTLASSAHNLKVRYEPAAAG